MVTDKFILELFAMVVTLGMMKYSVDRKNYFLIVFSLVCCFCVLETVFPVEKQSMQWLGFWGCLVVLSLTSHLYVAILRKLNYTQELVKKMTDKGWPKWIFSWITHPNPGPVPEKGFFGTMLFFLTMNLIYLYFLIKMLGIVF